MTAQSYFLIAYEAIQVETSLQIVVLLVTQIRVQLHRGLVALTATEVFFLENAFEFKVERKKREK